MKKAGVKKEKKKHVLKKYRTALSDDASGTSISFD